MDRRLPTYTRDLTYRPFSRFTGWFHRDEHGGILILSLFLFVATLLIGGVAIDMMRYESERVRVQGTADRAALAAAMMRESEGNNDPEAIVRDYFESEGLGHMVSAPGSINISNVGGAREVEILPQGQMRTLLMRLAGVDTLPIKLAAAASEELSAIKLELVMVLDVSGSMANQQRIENLRVAATDFVTEMLGDEEGDRVAITFVPYSTEVILPSSSLTYFNNLADPPSGSMHNAFCVDFSTWDSVTNSIDAPMFRRNCDLGSNTSYLITDMPVRPYLNNVDEAVDYINTLGPNWGTSIDLGLRVGALFFDPTIRPIISDLIQANVVSPEFADRPLDWNEPASYRAVILMTDGENCCFHPGHPATRKPDLETQDADTVAVCDALKAQNVSIYGVAFEAPPAGVALMEACASSPSHYFNSSGTQLVEAFKTIATHIQTRALRLTK